MRRNKYEWQMGIGFIVVLLSIHFLGVAGWAGEKEDYPTRPVDLIRTSAAGGPSDLPARVVLDYLSKKWGQSLNIVFKPGGGTIPGTLAAVSAKPDGYTLQVVDPADTVGQSVVPGLPFKWDERTWICRLTTQPYAMYIKAGNHPGFDKPWHTLADVAEAAKKSPEKFKFASVGSPSGGETNLRRFFRDAGIDVSKLVSVVYTGTADMTVAMMGDNVFLACGGISGVLGYHKAGTLKIVAVSGEKRAKFYADLPTAAEQGYPSVKVQHYVGIGGPPRLPQYVADKWMQGVKEALQDPGVISRLTNIVAEGNYLGPDEFRSYIMDIGKTFQDVWGTKK